MGGIIVLRKMIIMRGRSEIAIMSETNEERGIEIIATGETGMIGRRGMTDAIGTATIVEGEMDTTEKNVKKMATNPIPRRNLERGTRMTENRNDDE